MKVSEQSEAPPFCLECAAFPLLPAGQFGGEFGEEVAGSAAAGLRQRGGVVGQGGGGRRPVVRDRKSVV